jgi:hypothetical protein
MKSFRSPLKLFWSDAATKLKTVIWLFWPCHRFHDAPARVTVAMDEPVELMGPAPPRALSQIMISYSGVSPQSVLEKRSYATLATMSVPV